MYVGKESRKWWVALIIHPYQNLDSKPLAKEETEECLKETDPAFIPSFVLNTASSFKLSISHSQASNTNRSENNSQVTNSAIRGFSFQLSSIFTTVVSLISLDSSYYFLVSSVLKAYWSYPLFFGMGGELFFKEQDMEKSTVINISLE